MSDDARFRAGLDFIWRPENDGQPLHTTHGDAGGATSWGVTFGRWIAWRQLHQDDGVGGTLAEFGRLTRDDFEPFYRAVFWNVVRGDDLRSGIGLIVFDAAVLSGASRAARWLQRLADTTQDGVIGPATLAAARGLDPAKLIDDYAAIRSDFYRQIAYTRPENARFLNGWLRRCRDAHVAALAALVAVSAAAPAPPPEPVPVPAPTPANDTAAAPIAADTGVGPF